MEHKIIRTLTGTRNREHDLRRMPGTDTSNLAETLVGLARELLGAPTVGDTLETVTLGHRNNVDNFVLLEYGGNRDGLLEEALRKLDLVRYRATVNLNLHKVRLLLAEAGLANLGVRKDTDNSTVFPNTLDLAGDRLATVLRDLLGVTGEGFLLRAVPVLVEAALELVGKVGSPDGGEGAETTGSLDVANNANNYHRRGFDDSDSLHNLTLMHL